MRVSGRALLGAGVAVVLASGCGDKESASINVPMPEGVDEFGLPRLEIWREPNLPSGNEVEESTVPEGEDSNALFTNAYSIPPALASGRSGGDEALFPSRFTAREALEYHGVVFGPGTSVMLSAQSSQLVVRQTREQMQLIELLLQQFNQSASRIVNLRVEVFEVPAKYALKLQHSSETQGDHRGEWEAVLRMMGEGRARFVTSATIPSGNGQRAKVSDGQEIMYFTPFDKAESGNSPRYTYRQIGTVLTVDPIISPDNTTVDVGIEFEYHSAPPTEKLTMIEVPGADTPVEVMVPVFHVHKIETQLELTDGEAKIIGVWRPTGKPEFEKKDLMQVAFLKTDIQPVFEIEKTP